MDGTAEDTQKPELTPEGQDNLESKDVANDAQANAGNAIPPLELEEKKRLLLHLPLVQLLLLVIGTVGAVIATGFASGDWSATIFNFLWAQHLAESFTKLSLGLSIGLGVGFVVLLLVLVGIFGKIAENSDSARKAMLEQRQGINGEMIRLPSLFLAGLCVLVGLAEELLYRYAIFGLLFGLLDSVLPYSVIAFIALLVSVFVFTWSHFRYRNVFTVLGMVISALTLGIGFLVTESLLVVAISHALYDFVGLMAERSEMKRNPDFFGGSVPTRLLLDQRKKSKKK